MKGLVTAALVLGLAIPAVAGQNPYVAIYLYSTSTGIGGTNHLPSPPPETNASVYVCFDHFGPFANGVGGGMLLAQWRFLEVPGPEYLDTMNLYAGVGGLTIGVPGVAPGCAMTVGPTVYPDANGVIVLARVRYTTPLKTARGGTITVVPPDWPEGGVVADANIELDYWRVHSVEVDGLSGNFVWDEVSPVEARSWGSIKALYR
jgi:hypothetical protein